MSLWGKERDYVKSAKKKKNQKTNILRSLLYIHADLSLSKSVNYYLLLAAFCSDPSGEMAMYVCLAWWLSSFKTYCFPFVSFGTHVQFVQEKRSPGSYWVKWALPPVSSAVITGVTAPESIQSMLHLSPIALGIIHLWACFPGQVRLYDLVFLGEKNKKQNCNAFGNNGAGWAAEMCYPYSLIMTNCVSLETICMMNHKIVHRRHTDEGNVEEILCIE